ncbi:MAG: TIGR02996 domain-containing protein [Gemmataceae bacterium]|nr:TIGR02996 domain-containing protein [Gemmataceae bacterium]
MDDNAAFIQSIAEDPACDTRRLVYADWLDENGDPRAADFLRAELELAQLPPDASEALALRSRLWAAWACVDPKWLMAFTQPGVMRANPTPFPSAWKNFGLGSLRAAPGTYGTWLYESVPRLPLDELRGEFQYLGLAPALSEADERAERHRQSLDQMLAASAQHGVRLPESFVRFMGTRTWHSSIRSVTGCYFTLPDSYSPVRHCLTGEGVHFHFYADSQSCVLWDLYVHPSGAHCVIARWLDYFDPDPPEWDDEEPDEKEPPYTGPRAWFVAPSFEAFVYRVWIENQIWYIEHADFFRQQGQTPPLITPQIQAYMDHYRNQHGSE